MGNLFFLLFLDRISSSCDLMLELLLKEQKLNNDKTLQKTSILHLVQALSLNWYPVSQLHLPSTHAAPGTKHCKEASTQPESPLFSSETNNYLPCISHQQMN